MKGHQERCGHIAYMTADMYLGNCLVASPLLSYCLYLVGIWEGEKSKVNLWILSPYYLEKYNGIMDI